MSRTDVSIFQDLANYATGRKSFRTVVSTLLTSPGFLACVLYRYQHGLVKKGRIGAAGRVRALNVLLTGADFVPGCEVGPDLRMHHPNGVVIGGGTIIGGHCTILQQTTFGERYADGREPHLYPRVGDHVTVGAGARVLGGLTIGDGASVGANAVVTRDVPSGHTAVGAPARTFPQNVRSDGPDNAAHGRGPANAG